MADVRIGYGAQFWMEDASSTLVKLAEVTEVSVPNPQQSEVEATHFESPGRAREYVPGLVDNGEITLGLNYIAGSATDLLIAAAVAGNDPRDCKVIIPTVTGSGTWEFTFSGIFKGYERNIPIDDRQTATVTIRVNGAVSEAAGA